MYCLYLRSVREVVDSPPKDVDSLPRKVDVQDTPSCMSLDPTRTDVCQPQVIALTMCAWCQQTYKIATSDMTRTEWCWKMSLIDDVGGDRLYE